MSNFVNHSYHKEHSEETTSSQISFYFEYGKYNLSLDKHAVEFQKKLTVDFLNNSNADVMFEPNKAEIAKSKAPWLKWEEVVAEEPTVINTTARSLADLFLEDPTSMNHLRKTINFYLSHEREPKLSDLLPLVDQPFEAHLKNPSAGNGSGRSWVRRNDSIFQTTSV